MFRRIAIATDFSETAMNAARYAIALARTFHAQVELVHAWHVPVEMADGLTLLDPSVITSSRRGAEAQLATTAQKLGITTTALLDGDPDVAVVAHAQQTRADLLVMGTRGRTGLAHVLLGSVAERMVRTSDVPVLTVPHDYRIPADGVVAPKHLLVPVDLETASAEILETALALASATHGRVCAVHAWEMPFYFAAGSELAAEAERKEKERFDGWVRSASRGNHAHVDRVSRNGTPGDVIHEVAEEQRADLLVMATAGRTGIVRFLLGSVTERTLRSAHVPVLTFRRPPEHPPLARTPWR
jgi:nucleotide-binding universal stress UspA family protein